MQSVHCIRSPALIQPLSGRMPASRNLASAMLTRWPALPRLFRRRQAAAAALPPELRRRSCCRSRRCCGRRCRSRVPPARRAAHAAQRLHLGQALLFLVHAHGDELDHRLGDAQTALQFQHHRAVGFNGEQNVVAVVELAHHVGELAPAHLLHRLHHAAASGHRGA